MNRSLKFKSGTGTTYGIYQYILYPVISSELITRIALINLSIVRASQGARHVYEVHAYDDVMRTWEEPFACWQLKHHSGRSVSLFEPCLPLSRIYHYQTIIMSPQEQQTKTKQQDSNALGIAVVLGLIGAAASFTMYPKRAGSMIKQMNQIAAKKAKRTPPRKPGPMSKQEWDKVRPRIDKDDFVWNIWTGNLL